MYPRSSAGRLARDAGGHFCSPRGCCPFSAAEGTRFRSGLQRRRPRFRRQPRPVLVLPVMPVGALALSCTLLASPLQGTAPIGTGASRRWSRGEETETGSVEENMMLEVVLSSGSVGVHVARVALLCLRPCFWEQPPRYARHPRYVRHASAMVLESLRSLSTFRTFCLLSRFCSNTPEEYDGRRNRLREYTDLANARFNGVSGLLAGCRRGRRP